jgi:ribosomal protein S12 methylthiotransferase accessory factor
MSGKRLRLGRDAMEMKIDFPGGKRTAARFKGFTVMTDQPADKGGEGSAPQPFDMFLVSLGTCAGFYALAFCQTREIDTEGLELTLTTERDKAKKMLSRVQIEIRLPAGFPGKYRGAVVKAAEYCAVVKHLHDPPSVEVTARAE